MDTKFEKILQLSHQTRVGDWFMHEDHTILRVFGAKVQPYKLPVFLPLKNFTLECLRQNLNSDQIIVCKENFF